VVGSPAKVIRVWDFENRKWVKPHVRSEMHYYQKETGIINMIPVKERELIEH
jgi:hypothetical protein